MPANIIFKKTKVVAALPLKTKHLGTKKREDMTNKYHHSINENQLSNLIVI